MIADQEPARYLQNVTKATIKPRTAAQILRTLGVSKQREAKIVALLKVEKKSKGSTKAQRSTRVARIGA